MSCGENHRCAVLRWHCLCRSSRAACSRHHTCPVRRTHPFCEIGSCQTRAR
jgi:hypothetical protein